MNQDDNTIEQLSNEWSQFGKKYDIHHKHSINELNDLNQRIDNIEVAMKRPDVLCSNLNRKDSALIQLLRKGGNMDDLEIKSFSSSHDEGGGLIIPSVSSKITSNLLDFCPIRKLANITTISSNVLELVLQDGKFASGWVAEDAKREDTDSPKLKRKKIPVYELYAQPKATQLLLDDAAINFEQWLIEQLVDSFSKNENNAFLHGDGQNKPEGILKGQDIESIKIMDENLNIQDIITLISALSEKYLQNAAFLMNRLVFAAIQNLVDRSGRLIWQPSGNEKRLDTIFGIPVLCCSEMPNDIIILGDFQAGYQIVDRAEITIVRDPYTEKPFVKFYSVKRVGGSITRPDAFRFLTLKRDN